MINLDKWYWRNPLPQGNPIEGIAFGNGRFVAVTDLGGILISSDNGDTWRLSSYGDGKELSGVAYGNNTFVAVGKSGAIMVSKDYGDTWEPHPYNTADWIWEVSYVNDIFMALGEKGLIITSGDGIAWESKSYNTSNDLYDVVYDYTNDRFVVVGYGGIVLKSTSSGDWDPSGSMDASCILAGIAYDGSNYVVAGSEMSGGNDTKTIWASSDASNWVKKFTGDNGWLPGIIYASDTFIVVGHDGTILKSASSIDNWQPCSSGTSLGLYDISYGDETFITGGENGIILTSGDKGDTWKNKTFDISSGTTQIEGITYGGGTLVAVCSDGTVLTSPDGMVWSRNSETIPGWVQGVAYGNSTFAAISGIGEIYVSKNGGGNWELSFSDDRYYFNQIVYGAGKFVVVGSWDDGGGNKGVILTSDDNGTTWSASLSDISYWFTTVTYGSHGFMAFASDGSSERAVISNDGDTWKWQSFAMPYYTSVVGFGNNIFAAAGNLNDDYNEGFICTSEDNGGSWVTRASGIKGFPKGICWGRGVFTLVGDYGMLFSSAYNGESWQSNSSGTYNDLKQAVYDGKSFIIVGGNGTILQSAPATVTGKGRGIDLDTLISLYNSNITYSLDEANGLLSNNR